MSLILEALKKSEQQRQREKAPSLQSIHQPIAVTAKKPLQPWWIFAAFIVLCNVAFFGYWFWREPNAVAPVVQTPSLPPSDTAQSATRAMEETSTPGVSSPSPIVRNIETPQAEPEFTQISPSGSQAQPMQNEPAQRVEEISELPESVRNNLPAMTFSFHVYSESPEQRTIIINDRRVREGDEISAGLSLQSITPDGVILLFEQHRIHISVLSDW